MRKKSIGILIIAALSVLFFLWQTKERVTLPPSSNSLRVTTSFYPLAFLAKEIGGDKITVHNITPAGAEPHEYEPSPRDTAEIEQSNILIINGLNLEPWYKNTKQNINPQKTTILIAGDSLGKSKDPHVWLSPTLMKTMAGKITETFSNTDPKNKSYYEENFQLLKTKLSALDAEYRQGLFNCEQRNIVTSHSAFGYLASDYGLTQISIAGLSPDIEPSPKQMISIATFAKANKVKYIFFESLASPKLSQTIAEEIKAKTLVLNPLEGLTKEEISQGKNYLSVMRENLANLQIALSCKK